jgi:hypothetical protein
MNHAVCNLNGHRVEASGLSSGRINIGIDGSLVGNAQDLSCAMEEIKELIRLRHPHDPVPSIPDEFVDRLSGIRDDILEVMRDGRRIDRYLEITCTDDPPCILFLTTQDTDRVQFRVDFCDGLTEDEEIESADAILSAAREYLLDGEGTSEIESHLGDSLCSAEDPCGALAYYDLGEKLPWRIADDHTAESFGTLKEAIAGAKAWRQAMANA